MAPRLPRALIGALVAAALAIPAVYVLATRPAASGQSAVAATIHFAQEPDTLNPFLSPMSATSAIAAMFYSGLVTLDDKGAWQPDLAEQVPTVANGGVVTADGRMRVTYKLRKTRWHDGKPFTAQDVVATWKMLVDPAFPSISRAGYDLIARIETPDPQTAVVVFKEPYAPYLELFPFVLQADVIKADQAKAAPGKADQLKLPSWSRTPIGTGPYRFERWISGERLIATANPDYFRGRPGIPRLEVLFIENEGTAYGAWRAGGLDVLQGAPPTEYDALQREAPERTHVTPSATWEHVLFNLEHPILKDLRVRQAIAHLMDRQQLIASAYGGVLLPAWSEVPTFSWAYNPAIEHRYPHDPAKAGQLLDAAGWKLGKDGVRQKGGQPLALTILTTSEKPSRSLAAQIWRKQWQPLGIQLAIEKQPASTVFGAAVTKGRLATGHFDLALISSISRPDPDTSFRWRSDQVPPNGQNRARYRNAEVDAWLTAGVREIEPARRRVIYHKLATQLMDDLPALPLLYWVGIDATSSRLEGFKPNPTLRGNLWNVWEWKLVQRDK